MMQENSSGEFEIVDKMATVSDPSTSGRSVLTNVAPPSALPSFLTSPLPSAVPSVTPPSGPSIPSGPFPPNTAIAPSPGQSVPVPGSSVAHPHGPSVPPFTSSATPTTDSSVPSPRTNISPSVPPSGSSTVSCPEMNFPSPGGVPSPNTYSVNPGAGILSPGTGSSSGTYVPSNISPFPLSPSSKHPPTPLQSHSTELAVDSQSSQAPQPSNASSPVTSQPQPPNSHGSADASASVDIGSPGVVGSAKKNEGHGWFGWIRGTVSSVGHRVAERAKTSMDNMITTLDPQMKEFIYSGGDMDIVVASDKEVKVGAIREAFQMSFGKATVCGMKAEAQGIAAQPVGFEAALNSAEGRINFLRSTGQIHPQQPIVAVENFIVEFHSDCWFDLGLLLLDDPGEDILLQTYTQVTPVPPDFVNQARSATPEDYPFKESGFAVTVGQVASQSLQVHHTMWQEALTGVSRRETLVLAGRTLAGLYRSRLPNYH